MASKVFLDANIILDFTLKRESYLISRELMELVTDGLLSAFITPPVVQITGYWLTNAYGNSKAKELLLALLAYVSVIDISHEVTLNALHSKIKNIEFALQYYAAVFHTLDYFITRDMEMQKASLPILPIYSPEAFLSEIFNK